jgi:hypothetical protein
MKIRTVQELTAPGDYVRHLTPLGFDLQGRLTPEASLKFIQGMVADCDLAPEIPEHVRVHFDRCRMLHTYGFFAEGYEFFTVAAQITYFALEIALGAAFMRDSPREIPLVRKNETLTLRASSYHELFEKLNDRWRVRGDQRLESAEFQWRRFNGSMKSLLAWARAKGLLYGGRNAVIEDAILNLRHAGAHPHSMYRVDAFHSASAIRDAAEIINHLWGKDTCELSGRLRRGC